MKEIKITKSECGGRLDKYLIRHLPGASKGFLYKMLRKKNITLNGSKATGQEILSDGDTLRIYFSDETFMKMSMNEDFFSVIPDFPLDDLDIVYEDDEMIIMNKPAGLLSQKSEQDDVSLNDLMLSYLYKNGYFKHKTDTFMPSIVNRLDRNTSGIIIGAKTYNASVSLSAMLKDRECHKYYRCIVKGVIETPRIIEGYLYKDRAKNTVKIYDRPYNDAKYIKTGFKPISCRNNCTYLEVELFTGRTHQIRAHLAHYGHPIIGDTKYGDSKDYDSKNNGLLLHSYKLVMPDNREFIAAVPDRFKGYK